MTDRDMCILVFGIPNVFLLAASVSESASSAWRRG